MHSLKIALTAVWGIVASCAQGHVIARDSNVQSAAPVVDLGYSQYQGYYDAKFDRNVYKG